MDSGIETSEYIPIMLLPGNTKTEPIRNINMMDPEKKNILCFYFCSRNSNKALDDVFTHASWVIESG